MTEKKDIVADVLDKAKPILANIGFGSVMGVCTGIAFKRVGQSLAVVIGMGFVGIQVAAGMGYIEMKWDKVVESTKSKMDFDKDGKLDIDDVKEIWKRLKMILTHKLPSAGGFSLGFLFGVRYM